MNISLITLCGALSLVDPMSAEERQQIAAAEEARISNQADEVFQIPSGILVAGGLIYIPSMPDKTNGWVLAVSGDGSIEVLHWYGSPTSTVAEIKQELRSRNERKDTQLRAELKASRKRIQSIKPNEFKAGQDDTIKAIKEELEYLSGKIKDLLKGDENDKVPTN